MLYVRQLSRLVLAVSLISVLAGCAKKEEVPVETTVEVEADIKEKFDDVIPSLIVEDIGPNVDECLTAIDEVLSELDIPVPYSIFDNRFSGASQLLQFDVLDSSMRFVHVDVRGTKTGVRVHYSYDTSEEDKEVITRLLQEMLGESVYIQIEDTYTEYVVAHAQGREYRWKDGHLERMP